MVASRPDHSLRAWCFSAPQTFRARVSIDPVTIQIYNINKQARQDLYYNVTSPGYKSQYAFTVTFKAAARFVEIDIVQIEVPVCLGRKYKISVRSLLWVLPNRTSPSATVYMP